MSEISKELVSLIKYLNDRTLEYDEGHPTITDKEWDDKYFELICLHRRTDRQIHRETQGI